MQGLAALRAAGVGSCTANTFFVRWKTAWHWRGGRELHIPTPGSRRRRLLEGEGQALPSPLCSQRRAASRARRCRMVAPGGTRPGPSAGSRPPELPRRHGRGALHPLHPRCGAVSRAGSPARCFLQAVVPFPLSWPPAASPVLSRSSLLNRADPLCPHRECFGGHEPFSINRRLRALPSSACGASSSSPRPPASHRCPRERLPRTES